MPKNILIILLLNISFLFAQNYGTWRDTDSLNTARTGHAMVVLQNGNILVSGNDDIDTAASNKSCEIFDVSIEIWRETKPMLKPMGMHHMVLLDNGEVLAFSGIYNKSCEIYNPTTEEWRFTDSMLVARDFVNSGKFIKLDNGEILLIGGNAWNSNRVGYKKLKSCEIFDPITEKWKFADSLIKPSTSSSAIKLNNGNVLVAGSKYCQIYNTEENKWKMTDSLDERGDENAMIMLENGNVLLVGGGCPISPCDIPIDKRCAIYNTVTNKWSYVGKTIRHRMGHSVFRIDENHIIIIGGDIFNNTSWEIYDTKDNKSVMGGIFSDNPDIAPRIDAANTIQMQNGNIIANGGWVWDEAYSPPTVTRRKRCLIFDVETSIETNNTVPFNYNLSQNYPNPFNPSTIIRYELAKGERQAVRLAVYNTLGQEVAVLVNREQSAGNYEVKFNASTSSATAKNLPSGIYYYQLNVGKYSETKKMILIR